MLVTVLRRSANVNPRDRLQRATYFLTMLSTPKTQPQAIDRNKLNVGPGASVKTLHPNNVDLSGNAGENVASRARAALGGGFALQLFIRSLVPGDRGLTD